MDNPTETTTSELRQWHREGDYQRVLEALDSQQDALVGERLLLLALSVYMSGDADTGAELLQRATDDAPDNLEWKSDLALGKILQGDLEAAEALLDDCLHCPQVQAVDYGRKAAVCLARQDVAAAERYYQEAVDREPGRVHWHHNLAGVMLRAKKYEQALEQYEVALGVDPEYERSVAGRRQLLLALDRTEELVEELEARLAEDEDATPVRMDLARALSQDGRHTDAMRCLADAITPLAELLALKEDDADGFAQVKQDQILLRALQGEFLTARAMDYLALLRWEEIDQLEPEDPIIIGCARSHALVELGRFEEAEELLEGLLEAHPEDNQVKIEQSHYFCEKGDFKASEELLRDLVEVYPGNAALLSNLGQTLMWVGKLDEAAECYEKASHINPMALAQQVKTRDMPTDPAAIEKMEEIAENLLVAAEPRANMSFALADHHHDEKNYERAAHFLSQANRLLDKTLHYSADSFERKVSENIEVFTADYFAQLEPIPRGDRTPVFIVGMPRSGTTLTEQIVCSHPAVFGAGELDLLPVLTRLMPRVIKRPVQFPRCMKFMTSELRKEAARYYLYGLLQHNEDLQFVVDKMPHNFMNLGLVASILPDARIIHVYRDPRDTALSNFQQNFKAKDAGMGYAFNLENIARQQNDHHRMMQHWRKVLPLPVFELNYESLVGDQEANTRALLEFIGVDWHEQVTDFHKTDRAVRTASVTQVRQPMYTSSRQKWKNYQELLAPLIEALDAEVLAPWN